MTGEVAGHRIAHAAIALLGYTRFIAYTGPFGSAIRDSSGPSIITGDGQFVWVYGIIWGLLGVMATIDCFRTKTSLTIKFFIVLAGGWGASYVIAWVVAGFTGFAWMSAALYLGIAVLTLGADLMIGALKEQRNEALKGAFRTETMLLVTGEDPRHREESGKAAEVGERPDDD